MNGEKQSFHLFDTFVFPKIFQSFRMAIQPAKLIIAFFAIAVLCLAGWLMDFRKTVVTAPSSGTNTVTELQIYISEPEQFSSFIERYGDTSRHSGVFSTLWYFTAQRFHHSVDALLKFDLPAVAINTAQCFKAAEWAFRYHMLYSIVFFVINLSVISIAVGALCRISALQISSGIKAGMSEGLGFSVKKFPSLFAAPLVPLGIIIFLGAFIFIFGLVGNIPVAGELITAISMPLIFIAGAIIAAVVTGAVAGFGPVFPAVAYDGSDCFESISRAFSYIYTKPWRMGFYTVIAAVYGAICYIFVRIFAFLLLSGCYFFLSLGLRVNNAEQINKLAALWPKPEFMNLAGSTVHSAAGWSQSAAAFLIHLSVLVVIGLLVSFVISFYFTANTIIYSLMRSQVDGTSVNDIYRSAED